MLKLHGHGHGHGHGQGHAQGRDLGLHLYRERRPTQHRLRGRSHAPRQRGIWLIEALVAMAILALAVAGMLGMQLRSWIDAQASAHRAQAVRLADDLAERIKAQPGGLAALAAYATDWEAAPAAPDCRAAPGCDEAGLASWDIAQWKRAIADALPGGRGATFEDAGRRRLIVAVGWRTAAAREPGGASTVEDASSQRADPAALAADPQCPPGLFCYFTYAQH